MKSWCALHKFRIALLGLCLLVGGHAAAQDFATPYGRLLGRYVYTDEVAGIRTTLVDYAGWAKNAHHKKAMKLLKNTNIAELKAGATEMAFWINAYNLLTIDLIIQQNEQESIKNLGSLFSSPWTYHEWQIDGIPFTLDEIEHKILRPMGDPRIHMAINCASLSCPDLHNSPYMAEILEEQLTRQTQKFLENKTKGVAFASAGLQVSNIFNWFEADFGGGEAGVVTFIKDYINIPKQTPEKIKGYLNYNWQLNGSWTRQ